MGHNQCSVVKKVVERAELFALFEAVVGSICSTSEFKNFVTFNMAEYVLNEAKGDEKDLFSVDILTLSITFSAPN